MVIDLPGLAILSVEAHEKEIGFARVIGHEVAALRSWELNGRERMSGGPGVVPAETAAEAVAAALAAL